MARTAPKQSLPNALVDKARSARRSLLIERIVRVFWPLWVLAALGASLWLLGFFETAPANWVLWTLAGFASVALIVLAVGVFRLRRPTRDEILRSLDEGLPDRAASMLDEELAVGSANPDAQRVWQAHRERLRREAEAARVPAADLRLSSRDPWGLRYVALLILGISFAYSRIGGADRVAALLDPTPAAAQAAVLTPGLEAWVAPPPYTGVAPIYLTEKSGESLSVPTGSVLTLRASGVSLAPDAQGIDERFAEDAAGVYGLTQTLTEGTTLDVVHEGASLGSWQLGVIPDEAPEIGVTEAPAPTATRGLGFAFTAEDDYGVTAARATITADRSGMKKPPDEIDEPIDMVLTPPAAMADEVVEQTVEQDFIEHPWAGSPVLMTLTAEDAAGHVTESEPIEFILPARIFTEPMAKAIIEQRRNFAWDYRIAWDVLDLIEAITDYPDDYFTDPTAFLATTMAKKRLTYAVIEDRVLEERQDILDLLWKAALRLEEGDLTNAKEQLRTAQRRLRDALDRGASEEEIEQLMAELRQAMNNYLDQMARQAQRDGQQGDQQMTQQDGKPLTREDLERMLDQLEQAAKDGSRDQAEQMLSMLSEMLENMQMAQGQGQGEGSQQEQALQDMMRRQQELADETFQNLQNGENGQRQNRPGQQGQSGEQGQQGQQGQRGQQGQGQQGQGQGGRQGQQGQGREPGAGQSQGQGNQLGQGRGQGRRGGSERGGNGTLPGRQEGLRGELEDLLGQVPGEGGARDALGDAEDEMGGARDDLRGGDLNGAIDRQARALDRLREGAQALAEQAAREQQGQSSPNGRQSGAETGQSADQLDPFGRLSRTFGPDDGEGVNVPEERARNRALGIQREIRRRQSERDRPKPERDYLDRLQKRF